MAVTRENIKRKRAIKRRQRIISFFRISLGIILLGVFAVLFVWGGMIVYEWGSAIYAEQSDKYDAFLERKRQRQARYDARFDSYANILFIGLDEGKENSGPQADSLILLSMDKVSGNTRLIIVPRYTITNIPGKPNPEAINNAYFYGGEKLLQESVAQLLGVTIHHYAVIDPAAFAEFVDLLGGVDIYVERNMDYDDPSGDLHIHIPQGFQRMNGETAQKYLRFRNDELGSVARLHRQQIFLKAMYDRVASPDVVAKLPQFAELLNSRVKMTAESYDIVDFVDIMSNLNIESPVVVTVPGTLAGDGSGAWICDTAKTKEKMDELFPPVEGDKDEGGWFGLW